jgi:hypothetical protein
MKWFLPLGEGGAIHKVDEDKLTTKKDGQATSTRSKRRPISIEGVSIIMDTPRYFFNILRLHDASFLGSWSALTLPRVAQNHSG